MSNNVFSLKKITPYFIFIIVLSGLFYGSYNFFLKSHTPPSAFKLPPTVVETAPVESLAKQENISATGTLVANQGVMIKSEVAGKVTKIAFKSGSYLEQGKPLVEIYPDILQAQLARNKAALRLSILEFQRYAALYKKGSISKSQYDQASARLDENKAITAQTEAELRQHTLVAPFSGQVGLRLVDLGDYVSPGQNIVSLQATDPIRLEFSIPEVYLNLIAIGQTVEVKTMANPETTLKGTVYAFNSELNANTRSLDIWARIPNKDHTLIPGTFAKVQLYAGEDKKSLFIPQNAIVYNKQGNYVFKVINNMAKKTPVTLGISKQELVEITSGLKEKDTVVTAGQIKLFDGSPVMLANQLNTSNIKKFNSASTVHPKKSGE